MNEQVWWYVARSGGIVAWVLVTLSVLWGLMLATRVISVRGAPAWLLDLHRWFGATSIAFTAVHLIGLVADSYVHFGWSELFVPMASDWQPGAVAWGIVAFYLLIAVEVTSLAMRWLPRKAWRYVHWSSFALFFFGTLHGLQAGTDTANRYYIWTGLASVQLVLFFTVVRLAAQRRFRRMARAAATRADAVPAGG